jgi:DNA-binding MarR family transcriptional regulator
MISARDIERHSAARAAHETVQSLIFEAQALVNMFAKRSLRLHPHDSLPPGARSVLAVLSRAGSTTVPQIARLRLTSRQNIQIEVNHLKHLGLVELIPNPAHRKSALVRITDKGAVAAVAGAQRETEFLSRLGSDIPGRELELAVRCLRTLRENMTAPSASKLRASVTKPTTARPRSETAAVEAPVPMPVAEPEEIPIALL